MIGAPCNQDPSSRPVGKQEREVKVGTEQLEDDRSVDHSKFRLLKANERGALIAHSGEIGRASCRERVYVLV